MQPQDTKGTRLPRDFPFGLGENARAYKTCLDLEEELESAEQIGKDVKRQLIYCRILGYLFHHPPGDRALNTVVSEILSCGGNGEKLLSLGQMYCDHLLWPLRSDWNPYSIPPSRPSGPFPETSADFIKKVVGKTPRDHSTAKKALVRDGFRCAITHDYDLDATGTCEELERRLLAEDENSFPTSTVCAYIFDKSIAQNSLSQTGKEECTSAQDFWGILNRLGNERLSDELSGDCVHRLEDIITLNHRASLDFHSLGLWFVATDKPHNYRVKYRPSLIPDIRPRPGYATFTTPDEEEFPLPSPDYLKIHAACGEIGNLSGASDYIHRAFIGMENMKDTLIV